MDGIVDMEACERCQELEQRVRHLEQRVANLSQRNQVLRRGRQKDQAQIRQLQSTVARLQQELREAAGPARPTAANSSIPPSANPPGARKPVVKKPTGRKSGAQPGHKGHGRKLLPVERMDQIIAHRPEACQQCQAKLPPSPEDRVVRRHQVAELPPRAVVLSEHQAVACRCAKCGQVSVGQIPAAILKSVCGPRLSAAMGYLSACAGVSRRGVEAICSCMLGLELSLGSVLAREKELSEALAGPYEQIKREVQQAPVKYVDETTWKRAAAWLWVAATTRAVVFLCSLVRTRVVMWQLLGEAPVGMICTDRYGVYDRYPKRRRGLCWSHLARDFQRCVDRGGASEAIGQEALAITREVFQRWRWFRRGKIGRKTLQKQLRPLRKRMRSLLQRGAASGIPRTAGLCKRLLKLQGAMWRFAQVEGLEPTNNLAERMLRGAVIWRKKSMGSDSRAGCRFVERMLSVTMTVKLRGGNVLDYLAAAVAAHREGQPAPAIG